MLKGKKFLSCLLTLLLLLTMIPSPEAQAADSKAVSPVISLEEVGAARGQQVTANIRIQNGDSVWGGGFDLLYDSSVLSVIEAKEGQLNGVSVLINHRYQDGVIRVSFAGSNSLPADCTLMTVTFQISENAKPGVYSLNTEKVKLYNEQSLRLEHREEAGSVTVQSVSLRMETTEAVPGQTVRVPILMEGGLHPAGGSFEIAYDASSLTPGAVTKGSVLSAHNLSANPNYQPGVIRVTWAGSTPVTENGTLCTLTFHVKEGASGSLNLSVKNGRFYDETAKLLDFLSQDGTIQIVQPVAASPKLWVVGGRTEEDGTASVALVMEGRGMICGGEFTLSYDPSLITLTSAESQAGNLGANSAVNTPLSPEHPTQAGVVKFSWAGAAPSVESQSLLILRFKVLEQGSSLTLSEVQMLDQTGSRVPQVDLRSGKIQPANVFLQTPNGEDLNVDSGRLTGTLDLSDASSLTDHTAQQITIMAAVYDNGKMSMVDYSDAVQEITFDSNGLAHVVLDIPCGKQPDVIKLFLLSAENKMVPCAEYVKISGTNA